jgi:phosphate transport system substrate-binding protein
MWPMHHQTQEFLLNKSLLATAAVATVAAFATSPALARDQIKIVGSSTVFPYTQAVVEEFAQAGGAAPVLESTGTGGGFKIFCAGIGAEHPDVTGASRAIKESEAADCKKNGVDNVTEVLIGYDGLSFAGSRKSKPISLTNEQLYLALASEVPVDGKLVANPHKKWSDIDASLPDAAITVYGPPPTSGTRDAWVELVMQAGCVATDYGKKMKEAGGDEFKKFEKEACAAMRQDGPFIEAGENDNLIVQRLEADPNSYGIFGYSFLFENQDKLQGATIEGVAPTDETIADGTYPVSRPLFFYVKNAHRSVIKGLDDFVKTYVADEAIGPDGYLKERGLVPLPDAKRKETQENATQGKAMEMAAN